MKLAFVFPGQASQSVGMNHSFAANSTVQDILRQADEALGENLSGLVENGPLEQLNLTVNTQPAVLASSYAMYAAYRQAGGPVPSLAAGHSLGEYTALCAAGVFTLAEAVRLVRFRAQVMQSAVPVGVGAMAAIIGLTDAQVGTLCEQVTQRSGPAGEVVEPVNFNCPGQVVIAGHRQAVTEACSEASQLGARRAVLLPVSAPFHSRLLLPAAEQLEQRLAQMTLLRPQLDVIANVDVCVHADPEGIRRSLARQAASPVQWVRTIENLRGQGVTHVVECGPGRILAGLIRRIDPGLAVLNISDAASLDKTLEAIGA